MSLLIVDDTSSVRLLFRNYLRKSGINDIILASSAEEALEILGIGQNPDNADHLDVDLILLDLVMPGINGIEACRRIKSEARYRSIPILVISSVKDVDKVEAALESGALDYIRKPVEKLELVARVKSALKLKHEMDKRIRREMDLEESNRKLSRANAMLERLSYLDPLTGIANRRYFDESYTREWKQSIRDNSPIGLVMLDIDHFKLFNDHYGHQEGDSCLVQVALALRNSMKRPADFVARYGGEEFAAVLPQTDLDGTALVAEEMRLSVLDLKIPHISSSVTNKVSISIGIGSMLPEHDSRQEDLISMADQMLYQAKSIGRNCVCRPH